MKRIRLLLTLFIFIVGPSQGGDLPKGNIYPVLFHSVGGNGDCAYIWTKEGACWVTYQFDDSTDEILYESLSWEIKCSTDFLHQQNILQLPPSVYFVGDFETHQDSLYERPILKITKWFIIPPFYKLNTSLESLFDFKECKLKNHLNPSDFSIPVQYRGRIKDEYISDIIHFQRIDIHSHVFAYPLLAIDIKERKITTLIGTYPNVVLCGNYELKEKASFPKPESYAPIMNNGINSWFLGEYDDKRKLFLIYKFIQEDCK